MEVVLIKQTPIEAIQRHRFASLQPQDLRFDWGGGAGALGASNPLLGLRKGVLGRFVGSGLRGRPRLGGQERLQAPGVAFALSHEPVVLTSGRSVSSHRHYRSWRRT